ncbi:MAG: hypothetical protein KA419_02470 [Acidobacteria bacterium]|nr:hypothetical protein [Acidobacteriota bacterium]
MKYRCFGLDTLHSVVGDRILCRNLVPPDPGLPSYPRLRGEPGFTGRYPPRKSDPDYGRAVAGILQRTSAADRPGTALRNLLYLGDTLMNDGTAFENLRAAGGWRGALFIGSDEPGEASRAEGMGDRMAAGRWAALPLFLDRLEARGFPLGEDTVVVVDIDKTAIAARGRNDRVIEAVRLEALRGTVTALGGPCRDEGRFREVYAVLKGPAFHAFTRDNQDTLAYVCLVVGAGLADLGTLVEAVRNGRLKRLEDFTEDLEHRRGDVEAAGLGTLHGRFRAALRDGNPTPFPAFRAMEYRCTAARFGAADGKSVKALLAERIVLTREVIETARRLRARGALVFGLSDKPDEAFFPDAAAAAAGLKPLHRLETEVVGEAT